MAEGTVISIYPSVRFLEVKAMSVNCTNCLVNKRTGFDLLCDPCRETYFEHCRYYYPDDDGFGECPVTLEEDGVVVDDGSICTFCPWFKEKSNQLHPVDRATECECKPPLQSGGTHCAKCGRKIPLGN